MTLESLKTGHERMIRPHASLDYQIFMAQLSRKRTVKTYFEIGVHKGEHFSKIQCEEGIAVDPEFIISNNIAKDKKNVSLFQCTSDDFFEHEQGVFDRSGPPDLAFLDGLHLFEFLLRDFFNTEAVCDKNSLIVLHDCFPLNAEMALRSFSLAVEKSHRTKYPYYWTGDVWKVVPILTKYRPDLRIAYLPCPPTGLVCITELDPGSSVLRDNYADIVTEYSSKPNDLPAIEQHFESVAFTDPHVILNDLDHSSHFRI